MTHIIACIVILDVVKLLRILLREYGGISEMKKKISMLLSAALLITGVFSAAVRAEFSDVPSENPYKEAITTLSLLETSSGQKILAGYEDGTFKPEGAVTRAECAKIITCVLNVADVNIDPPFTDVDSHWAKNNIGICASMGIINGMGDGTFAPDAQVTYEQLLKMVVCAIGYGDPAEIQGGYPDGYISQANSLGLLNKIDGQGFSDPAARGVVSQVIYNALEVNMAQTYDGITTVTNRTLLKDSLKIEKIKGTLVGVEETVTADCTRTLGRGMMDVLAANGDEMVLHFSNYTTDANEISRNLGQMLTVYYKDSVSATYPDVIGIDYATTQNKVLEISSFDIDSYSGAQLSYFDEKNSRHSERIYPDKISIRYNGKLIGTDDLVELTDSEGNTKTVIASAALNEWLNPSSDYYIYGSIRLVSSGSDGINLIEILDYETLVAYARPTTADYRVQDRLKTTNYLILDPNSVEYTLNITKDNATITTTDIAANDVLLYARSADGSVITVTDNAKPFTGSITAVSEKEGMTVITVDGKEHRVSDACLKYIKTNDGREMKAGVSGTFYPDALGTVAYATLSAESAIPYAYIISAADDVESDKIYVTAYLPSNSASNAKVYPMANRVTINGESMRGAAAVEYLEQSGSRSNQDAEMADKVYGPNRYPSYSTTAQLVRMKLNSEGSVSEIVTLDNKGEGSQNEDVSKLVRYQSLGRYYYTSNSFRESSSASSSLFTTNSSTAVIYIPMNRGDRDKYSNRTPSSAFSSGESYYVEAYNVNSSKIAGLVVLYGTDGSMTNVTRNTDFSIVGSQPGVEYNADKNLTSFRLSLYKGAVNTPTDWLTYDDEEFEDVQVGDVIQFAYDSDNLAQGLVMNIPFSDIAGVLDNTGGSTIYDWSEEVAPTERNNWQSYRFDYRFKATDSDGNPVSGDGGYADEPYTSTTIGTVPYLRAYMANVSQVLPEENKLYLTKKGFTEEDGEWVYDEGDYEELTVSSSTKVIRMENNRRGFSRYVDGTTADLKYTDLRDAKNYGTDCSKVLVCTLRGAVRLIVIYE